MSFLFNKRAMFFLTFLIFFAMISTFADMISDPVVQYNQLGSPYTANGGTPSGNYNDLNILGEGLTYDIPWALDGSLYRVQVWHNSSQIDDGNINSINATLNFTTNVSDAYSLQIYDWTSSVWINCNSGNVLADTATKWWCNMTSNPLNYNSSDRRVRIRINSTADLNPGLLREDYVQYYVGYPSYLEVNLTNPDYSKTLNVGQNKTFNVNATVVCKGGPCGEVFGTVMYNSSSLNPDMPIGTDPDDKPFFIQEYSANAKKSCGTMFSDDICKLNWTVNATGDLDTVWRIGVLFNSSYADIVENGTENSTVSIFPCTLDFNLSWSSIKFGLLDPNTGPNEASGNSKNEYNITVNPGSCNLDFYINGTALTNNTLNSQIEVGNISWSNSSNNYTGSFKLSSQVGVLSINAPEKTNVTTWYWINVPPVYSGYYNGMIYIFGVKNGENSP